MVLRKRLSVDATWERVGMELVKDWGEEYVGRFWVEEAGDRLPAISSD